MVSEAALRLGHMWAWGVEGSRGVDTSQAARRGLMKDYPDTSSAPRFPVLANPQLNGESEIQYLQWQAEMLRRELERAG